MTKNQNAATPATAEHAIRESGRLDTRSRTRNSRRRGPPSTAGRPATGTLACLPHVFPSGPVLFRPCPCRYVWPRSASTLQMPSTPRWGPAAAATSPHRCPSLGLTSSPRSRPFTPTAREGWGRGAGGETPAPPSARRPWRRARFRGSSILKIQRPTGGATPTGHDRREGHDDQAIPSPHLRKQVDGLAGGRSVGQPAQSLSNRPSGGAKSPTLPRAPAPWTRCESGGSSIAHKTRKAPLH